MTSVESKAKGYLPARIEDEMEESGSEKIAKAKAARRAGQEMRKGNAPSLSKRVKTRL